MSVVLPRVRGTRCPQSSPLRFLGTLAPGAKGCRSNPCQPRKSVWIGQPNNDGSARGGRKRAAGRHGGALGQCTWDVPRPAGIWTRRFQYSGSRATLRWTACAIASCSRGPRPFNAATRSTRQRVRGARALDGNRCERPQLGTSRGAREGVGCFTFVACLRRGGHRMAVSASNQVNRARVC